MLPLFRLKSVLFSEKSVPVLPILRCPGTPDICYILNTARNAWNPHEQVGIQTLLHTIIMYILYYWYRQGEGDGGREGLMLPTARGFLSRLPGSRLATRLASPRVVSPLVSRLGSKSRLGWPSRLRLRLPLRVRLRFSGCGCGSGYVLRCVSRKHILVPHPSPPPAGRQDPDCRPVPTHIMLTRTILGLYTSMFSRAIRAILSCPYIFLAYSTGSLHSTPSAHFPISLPTYPDYPAPYVRSSSGLRYWVVRVRRAKVPYLGRQV